MMRSRAHSIDIGALRAQNPDFLRLNVRYLRNWKVFREMQGKEKTAVENIKRKHNFKYVLILEGVLIGLITGAIISIFRLALTGADTLRTKLVEIANSGITGAILLASIMILIALAITWLLMLEPDIAGSGIPQVEAELRGQKDMCWYKVLFAKMAGCALAIGGGLALGREGPSIQLGAMVGKGVSRAGHRLLTEERLLITCGAGAGLSAAFGAPLAGALFALEELHRNFSAEVLLSTMAASAASDFVAANVFGLTPVFGFEIEHSLPLSQYWAVILVGIVVGFFGIIYNKTIAFMQNLFDRIGNGFANSFRVERPAIDGEDWEIGKTDDNTRVKRIATFTKLFVMFGVAFIMAFVYPEALGSGSYLVGEISRGEFTLAALVILVIVKFIFSTGSFGSGSPGGIFLPLLVLGAVSGGLICRILGIFGFNQNYITALVVVAMAGYFSAIVRAPITGVVLITEMTGDFTSLLPLVLVSLIAYVIPEYFGIDPIYTQLLRRSQSMKFATSDINSFGNEEKRIDRRTEKKIEKRTEKILKTEDIPHRDGLHIRDRKIVVDADVHIGSEMDGKSVEEFDLPAGTLIVSVLRDGVEIIPDGNTELQGGDELEILMRARDIARVEHIIDEKCKKVSEKEK